MLRLPPLLPCCSCLRRHAGAVLLLIYAAAAITPFSPPDAAAFADVFRRFYADYVMIFFRAITLMLYARCCFSSCHFSEHAYRFLRRAAAAAACFRCRRKKQRAAAFAFATAMFSSALSHVYSAMFARHAAAFACFTLAIDFHRFRLMLP